jgi:hypothetical protein
MALERIAGKPEKRARMRVDRDLIKRGATTSEDGRRHLIDERRSVALLKEQAKK